VGGAFFDHLVQEVLRTMSVRETIVAEVERIAADNGGSSPRLTDDLVLLDSGLDSLAIAILVARLEDALGIDPFTETDDVAYPVTFGDFVKFYEVAAGRHSGQAG
jgi:acyl carrier protein